MAAIAYKRPFAEPKGCISERQQPAISRHSDKRVFWELLRHPCFAKALDKATPVGVFLEQRKPHLDHDPDLDGIPGLHLVKLLPKVLDQYSRFLSTVEVSVSGDERQRANLRDRL